MTQSTFGFAPQGSPDEVEEGSVFAPKFDKDGLIPCIASDARTGEVLMVAYMNADALARTIESRDAWYFSRKRQALWRKGATSGRTQRVVEMRVDCDQDVIWIKIEPAAEGACHTGRSSCFYRTVPLGEKPRTSTALAFTDSARLFDPQAVYAGKGPRTGE